MNPKRHYNLDYLDELSSGDEDFKLEMLKHFFDTAGGNIELIKGLTLTEDWHKLRDAIHKFTPNMMLVGISDVIESANRLEYFAENELELDKIPELVKWIENKVTIVLAELQIDFQF